MMDKLSRRVKPGVCTQQIVSCTDTEKAVCATDDSRILSFTIPTPTWTKAPLP